MLRWGQQAQWTEIPRQWFIFTHLGLVTGRHWFCCGWQTIANRRKTKIIYKQLWQKCCVSYRIITYWFHQHVLSDCMVTWRHNSFYTFRSDNVTFKKYAYFTIIVVGILGGVVVIVHQVPLGVAVIVQQVPLGNGGGCYSSPNSVVGSSYSSPSAVA